MPIDGIADDELIVFEGGTLPEKVHATGNDVTRHLALLNNEPFRSVFVCRPWLNTTTGELSSLIRAETSNDLLDLTISQILLYLEEFVPWGE